MEAAEELKDEDILLQIRDRDLVALEVRYHRSCFKTYTGKYLRQVNSLSSDDGVLAEVFRKFRKSVIEERLMRN